MTAVTATVNSANWRVKLALSAINASANKIEVQRSSDSGVTWYAVRGDDFEGNPLYSHITATTRTVFDTEGLLDTSYVYRARGVNLPTAYVEAWSSNSAAVKLGSSACLYVMQSLEDPGSTVVAADASVEPGFQRDSVSALFYRSGQATPVVLYGSRHAGHATTFAVLATSDAQRDQIAAAVEPSTTVVIRAPIATVGPSWKYQYVTVGNINWQHRHPVTAGGWVGVVPWTAVDSPSATPVNSWGGTWGDLLTIRNQWGQLIYPNWNAIKAAFATWDALLSAVF